MKSLKIHSPIWSSMSIGIASFRISDDLKIDILWKDKFNNRRFPDTYFMKKEKILTYPIKIIYSGIRLFIVPIKDLEVLKCK